MKQYVTVQSGQGDFFSEELENLARDGWYVISSGLNSTSTEVYGHTMWWAVMERETS